MLNSFPCPFLSHPKNKNPTIYRLPKLFKTTLLKISYQATTTTAPERHMRDTLDQISPHLRGGTWTEEDDDEDDDDDIEDDYPEIEDDDDDDDYDEDRA
jgi:hypothetical protein